MKRFVFIFLSVSNFSFAIENVNYCYIGLNNSEKELAAIKSKIESVNATSSQKKITLIQKSKVEDFIATSTLCHVLEFSGHFSGFYFGAQSATEIKPEHLENLACQDRKHRDWFKDINLVVHNGCRTMSQDGLSPVSCGSNDATEQTNRVLGDHPELNYDSVNAGFNTMFDELNPLPLRFRLLFPNASSVGWSGSAPGEKAGSERITPGFMDEITRSIDRQNAMDSLFKAFSSNECSSAVCDSWNKGARAFGNDTSAAHGPLSQNKEAQGDIEKSKVICDLKSLRKTLSNPKDKEHFFSSLKDYMSLLSQTHMSMNDIALLASLKRDLNDKDQKIFEELSTQFKPKNAVKLLEHIAKSKHIESYAKLEAIALFQGLFDIRRDDLKDEVTATFVKDLKKLNKPEVALGRIDRIKKLIPNQNTLLDQFEKSLQKGVVADFVKRFTAANKNKKGKDIALATDELEFLGSDSTVKLIVQELRKIPEFKPYLSDK